jgi:hypothetical protein
MSGLFKHKLTMNQPTQSTVEAILSQLDGIPRGQSQSFELWIPQHLVFRGKVARADLAMAIILDKILGMGYGPDGFSEAEGGRIYGYKMLS